MEEILYSPGTSMSQEVVDPAIHTLHGTHVSTSYMVGKRRKMGKVTFGNKVSQW